MKIYLTENQRNDQNYKDTFKVSNDGEVSADLLKKLWGVESDEKLLEKINKHPSFYVQSAPDNGNSSSKKDGSKTSQQSTTK